MPNKIAERIYENTDEFRAANWRDYVIPKLIKMYYTEPQMPRQWRTPGPKATPGLIKTICHLWEKFANNEFKTQDGRRLLKIFIGGHAPSYHSGWKLPFDKAKDLQDEHYDPHKMCAVYDTLPKLTKGLLSIILEIKKAIMDMGYNENEINEHLYIKAIFKDTSKKNISYRVINTDNKGRVISLNEMTIGDLFSLLPHCDYFAHCVDVRSTMQLTTPLFHEEINLVFAPDINFSSTNAFARLHDLIFSISDFATVEDIALAPYLSEHVIAEGLRSHIPEGEIRVAAYFTGKKHHIVRNSRLVSEATHNYLKQQNITKLSMPIDYYAVRMPDEPKIELNDLENFTGILTIDEHI